MPPMTPQPQQPSSAESSALPVVALVLAIVGLCFPPLLVVAIVLAIVVLVKSHEPAYAPRKGLAIAALIIPLAAVPVVGVLAAIAIPNFIKFGARSKQSEAKSYLKAAFTAEKAYFAERDAYVTDVEQLGFSPDRGNRYLYLFDVEGPVREPGTPPGPGFVGVGADSTRYPEVDLARYRAALPPDLAGELGVHGTCPDCDVTVAAIGNNDSDDTLDVWSVSTRERVDRDGLSVPPGVPMHHVDDTRE